MFILKNNRIVIFLGILIGFFDYVRPVGGLFLYSIVIALLLFPLDIKFNFFLRVVKILFLVIGFVIFKLAIGQFHYSMTGHRVNGSISTGYNLLMGTGVNADGSWTSGVFNPGGKGYFKEIKSTNVEVKNQRWVKQSIDTIISNPSNFLTKGFRKLSLTFGYDLLAIQNITNPRIRDLSLGRILKKPGLGVANWLIVFVNNFIYYIIFIWFILRLFNMFFIYNKDTLNFANITLLIFVVFYLMVIFLIIGGARYHHILIPIMLYFNFQNYKFNTK